MTVVVVLALALGPTADPLCRAVCDLRAAAATSGCHHEVDVKGVAAGADECHSPSLVPGELPAGSAGVGRAPDAAGDTLPSAGLSVFGRTAPPELDSTASPRRLLGRRPLTTTLRI
jgi:hypothetical protein